jgi:putative Mg2+ transporter-C (MgtC) family protein
MDEYLSLLSQAMPDGVQTAWVATQLAVAALLGALIGIQRESVGKAAGLRTHMLVSLGAALFVISGLEYGMSSDGLSRVIQGLATGIGFIGGGAILKLRDEREITGLTTAAGIWMTSAVGVAVGLGRLGSAAIGAVLTWIILSVFAKLELMAEGKKALHGNGGARKK